MDTISVITVILLVALLSALMLLSYKRWQGHPIPLAAIVMLGVMASMLGAILAFVERGEDYQAYQSLKWHSLAPQRIAPLVADGYTVFVDITADWCMTCQANKANVTHREQIVHLLQAPNVVLMQGNWSEEDKLIAAYMQHEGVPGTPYNKIYGPNAPNGIVLPSQLTIADVTNGLAQAGASSQSR